MKFQVDLTHGYFYSTDFGHLYFTHTIKAGEVLELGEPVPLKGLFTMHHVKRGLDKVGYVFGSAFRVLNHGSLIVAYTSRGLAEEYETLVRLPHLVIFNYPNRGTLVVNPAVSPELRDIMDSQ